MSKAKPAQPEPEIIETAKMTDAEYRAFLESRLNDVSLSAQEMILARQELGRLNANG